MNAIDEPLLEQGSPKDDPRAFRRALGHFSTGVTIITAEADGVKAGLTVNSFSSVSLDPPLILWSVNKSSTSWPIFDAANAFAVNVLAAEQSFLASQFARSGGDKFQNVEWRPGNTGAPLLANVAAQFECLRHVEYDGGDHLIVVGEVAHFSRFERRPLVFAQGRFSLAIDHPETARLVSPGQLGIKPTFLALLRRAFLQRGHELREEAQSVGFTENESRLVYYLELNPGLDIETAARISLLDTVSATEAAEALRERGWVSQSSGGVLALTELGRENFARLQDLTVHAEKVKLGRFSDGEIEKARQVIASLATI
ncbi:flavin reductase [Mesorhizobium shangrilense]|uniref:Flavin reductase n=1 Tax=Mesorhizobium shangrilense TaxID=460060 RepID=A0ABV2DHS3_9HYPH